MSREPVVGGDTGNWGTILNDFLSAGHNADGTHTALAEAATLYVAADGNDSNDGLSWHKAKATVQAALGALPANGGIVEVGYGSFAGFTWANFPANKGYGITVRGRGVGQGKSVTDASVTSANHPTLFTSAITIDGTNVFTGTGPEHAIWQGVKFEDFGVSNGSGDGIVINCPFVTMRRITSAGNSGDGIKLAGNNTAQWTWFWSVEDCRFEANGGWGFEAVDIGPFMTRFSRCTFDGNTNGGFRANTGGLTGEEITFIDCAFQRQFGYAFTGACWAATFINCHFESNNINNTGGNSQVSANAICTFIGCSFLGNNVSFGLNMPLTGPVFISGCRFQNHTSASIASYSGAFLFQGIAQLNISTDPVFISGSGAPSIPANLAGNRFDQLPTAPQIWPQTLSTNGAVAFPALNGNIMTVVLSANATSSSISNPMIGQPLTIQWIQDGTGSRTYSWPANVRFAANTAPTATTTANRMDSVTFMWTGTVWAETARAINVPVT